MIDNLLARVRRHAENGDRPLNAPVPQAVVASAEANLGFRLPRLVVRLYTEIANGGFGPSYGLLGLVQPCQEGDFTVVGLYRDNIAAHENPQIDHEWPTGLIHLCEWGCGIFTCVDCNSPDARMVTHDPELTWTHWTLETWLEDWLDGKDIFDEMFGPPPEPIRGINPFTGEPCEFKGRGKAKY